jgi:methyl halide transferase
MKNEKMFQERYKTGDNAIWLAKNGFQVTGIDVSNIALTKARAKATKVHPN